MNLPNEHETARSMGTSADVLARARKRTSETLSKLLISSENGTIPAAFQITAPEHAIAPYDSVQRAIRHEYRDDQALDPVTVAQSMISAGFDPHLARRIVGELIDAEPIVETVRELATSQRDLAAQALELETAADRVKRAGGMVSFTDPHEEHYTDTGNARRLVRMCGDDLRFVGEWRAWLRHDGRRWIRDSASAATVALAKQAILTLYEEAAGFPDKDRHRAIDHARRSESEPALRRMVQLAQSEPGIILSPDALDRDPWLLNVQNGTIDLRTGEAQPHRRDDLITKMAGCASDPASQCPAWLSFLSRIMEGRADLIDFLQRAVGYALTGSIREQCLFVLYGTGANGKSTFLRVLLDLLGDYARQAPSDILLAKRNDAHPTGVAGLHGARLVSVIEVDEGRRLAEGIVKQITGGDRVSARFMKKDFFEYDPAYKIFLACNHKPVVRGTDLAIWRRIRLIPFTVTIPPEEQDHDLVDKLRAELPGILAWALQGCIEWQRIGLNPPAAVLAATDAYRTESDTLGAFIADRCTLGPDAWATKDELYKAYAAWAEGAGEPAISKRRFGDRLSERPGIADSRDHQHGRFWTGIGIQRTEGA